MNRYFGQQTLSGEWHALLPRYILISDRVSNRRILDIGCGSGIGASMLHEMGAASVDAIDHRPAVLNVAKTRSEKEGLHFQVMFWEDLAFDDDTFDLVLCLDPASPVTDPSLLLEVRRVLKPTGEYICAVERKMLKGLEQLLPRYGYPSTAEQIDMYRHQTPERVPQLGEVQRFFNHIHSVVQRPCLSFTFTNDHSEHPNRPLEAEKRLCDPFDDPGSVEIWFCSENQTDPVPEKIVQLPYSDVVQRLGEVTNHLHAHTMPEREPPNDDFFNEIVENPSNIEYTHDLSDAFDEFDDYGDEFGFEEPTIAKFDSERSSSESSYASLSEHSSHPHNNAPPTDELKDDLEQEFGGLADVYSSPIPVQPNTQNDFEERVSTNTHTKPLNELSDPQYNAPTSLPKIPQDVELEQLKEMFDSLTSVVERQSQMIQTLLQNQNSSTPHTPNDGDLNNEELKLADPTNTPSEPAQDSEE